MKPRAAIVLMLGLACVCGCKKREGESGAKVETGASQRRPTGFVSLNDQETPFAPTRMALSGSDPLSITLYSDDSAGDGDNTLHLTLYPQVDSITELNGVEYDIKATDVAWVESLEGFVLEKGQWVLQPYDVKTLVFCTEKWVRVELLGDFLAFDKGSDVPRADKVKVKGIWEGPLETGA